MRRGERRGRGTRASGGAEIGGDVCGAVFVLLCCLCGEGVGDERGGGGEDDTRFCSFHSLSDHAGGRTLAEVKTEKSYPTCASRLLLRSLSLSLSVCVRLSLSECASAFSACAGPPLAALLGYDPTYTQNCPIRDDSSEMAKNFTSMTLSRVAAAADLARALSLSLCTLRFDGASLSRGRGRPLRVRMRASPVLTPPAASRAHIPRLRRRCPCGCP